MAKCATARDFFRLAKSRRKRRLLAGHACGHGRRQGEKPWESGLTSHREACRSPFARTRADRFQAFLAQTGGNPRHEDVHGDRFSACYNAGPPRRCGPAVFFTSPEGAKPVEIRYNRRFSAIITQLFYIFKYSPSGAAFPVLSRCGPPFFEKMLLRIFFHNGVVTPQKARRHWVLHIIHSFFHAVMSTL